MRRKKMTLLVGPIASGKSTYAAQRARESAIIVNDDSIVQAVHGGEYMYDEKLKPLYVQIETAIITAAAMSERDVVVDRGCRSRSCRTRFASLGRSLGFDVEVKLFEWASPEEHATRRFGSDSRGYSWDKWLSIAEHHAATFEPVLDSEEFSIAV